jgi:hypothetical protein
VSHPGLPGQEERPTPDGVAAGPASWTQFPNVDFPPPARPSFSKFSESSVRAFAVSGFPPVLHLTCRRPSGTRDPWRNRGPVVALGPRAPPANCCYASGVSSLAGKAGEVAEKNERRRKRARQWAECGLRRPGPLLSTFFGFFGYSLPRPLAALQDAEHYWGPGSGGCVRTSRTTG